MQSFLVLGFENLGAVSVDFIQRTTMSLTMKASQLIRRALCRATLNIQSVNQCTCSLDYLKL